jgi:CheY-specific phosphatase CheX
MTNAMKTSIFKVLEQMFFLPINLEGADRNNVPGDGKILITSSVSFDGNPSGRFVLSMPEALAVSICADFLGVREDAVTNEHVNGTVKEMINMLAGNALMLFDHQELFNLHIPSILETDQLKRISNEYQQHLSIGIETLESRMTLTMMS